MEQKLIILVEDNGIIAELLEFNLHGLGYAVESFQEGKTFFQKLPLIPIPDLFILDLMLPGIDGLEICKQLRQQPNFNLVPILILTARNSEDDKVRGLEAGADDYLIKPFSMRELLARVGALTRRFQKYDQYQPPTPQSLMQDNIVINHEIRLDGPRHRVSKNGQFVELANKEYELLSMLMRHPGIAFSRDELLEKVWGHDSHTETRTVDVHIRQLRRKLEADDANPLLIQTVRGHGYRWTDLN